MNGEDDAQDDQSADGSAAEPVQFDAGDPVAVRKRETKAQAAKRQADDFWRGLFSTEIGRRELWKLITDQCHAFDERFACGPSGFPQPEATWFQAGQQSLGLRLYQSWLYLNPQGVFLMMAENNKDLARALAPPKQDET